MKIAPIVLMLFLPTLIFGQIKGDYTWELGFRSYPQNDPEPRSLFFNFSEGQMYIGTRYRPMSFDHLNASISDDDGELLLYTNGCQVRDGNDIYIEGTNNLSPGLIDDDWCIQQPVTGYPINGGGIFTPFFGDSIIWLFHQRLIIVPSPLTVYVDTLYYSKFRKNNNSYLLLEKSIPLISGKLTIGNLEAVRTQNGKGWWLIQSDKGENNYHIIRIENSNVEKINVQQIGDKTIRNATSVGQSAFSPDGKQYARFNPPDELILFDFDREEGILSEYRNISVSDSGGVGGLSFSPNSQFLYASTRTDLYQFDTQSKDIESSKIHLGHYDGYTSPFATLFFQMQMGPDCRIYMIPTNGSDVLHVIHDPNKKGLASNFEQHAIQLPENNTITLPNFPNYRLGIAPPCDPNLISSTFLIPSKVNHIEIFPNPIHGEFNVLVPQLKGKGNLRIMDLQGRTLLDYFIQEGENKFGLDLPSGMYICTIVSENIILHSGKFVVYRY